jgi:threonyl-tRNA synthetase
MERFVSILIEHFAGDFPLWLSPQQIEILPISDDYLPYAEHVEKKFREAGLRVHIDSRAEKVGSKIRDAETSKIPYMIIVGSQEQDDGTVSVRRHKMGDIGTFSLDEFLNKVKEEVETRALPPTQEAV